MTISKDCKEIICERQTHTTDDELDETADIAVGRAGTESSDGDDSTENHDNSAPKHHLSTSETVTEEE